jgi:hypothetical protein
MAARRAFVGKPLRNSQNAVAPRLRGSHEAGNVIAMHEHEGEVKATISTLPIDKIEKLAASERIAPRETVTES